MKETQKSNAYKQRKDGKLKREEEKRKKFVHMPKKYL